LYREWISKLVRNLIIAYSQDMTNHSIYQISRFITKIVIFIGILLLCACFHNQLDEKFKGERAYKDVIYQTSLGPRYPGSQGYYQTIDWISDSLENEGWQIVHQNALYYGVSIHNIIAKRGEGNSWIIIGAHYDTRRYADQDPDTNNRKKAVPGANDGASGVAVLLELARITPMDVGKEVWLVFFDAEDNGGINGADWAMGSRYFVETIQGHPDAVVILDMIGDNDLDIYIERSSNQELAADIWGLAKELGHEEFINQPKYQLIDDHTAFLLSDIPAIDIIDFDYPYWHTVEDLPDKVSSCSLQIVGETIFLWLMSE
jgi:glutaminyl-peptide cyclotransferase